MGIKERRERERTGTRRAILDAARDIAAAEGWRAVTIRRVADRIEYSPPTLYEHFSSKEAILQALLREGFHRLVTDLRAARAVEPDPRRALLASAVAYWEF